MNLKAMEARITALTATVKSLSQITIEGYNRHAGRGGVAFARGGYDPLSGPAHEKTVIIVARPVDADVELTVREARYIHPFPRPCTGSGDTAICYYEWYGGDIKAFPPLGVMATDYDGFEADGALPAPKLTMTFIRCHREHDAWLLDAPAKGGVVSQMKVADMSAHGDYLLCNKWDGVVLGTSMIEVARPYKLRRSVFDGLTVDGIRYSYSGVNDRTATRVADSKTETQTVVPKYAIGDIIYAKNAIVGGSAVSTFDTPPKAIVWLDLNVDGRAWAKKA